MNSPLLQHRRPPDESFPEAWLPYLHENVFLYGLLSDADQARMRRIVPRFIATKFWEGCAGLAITDEVRVTIAAQACLLLLGFDYEDDCFDDLKTILVYPGGYLGVDPDSLGIEDHLGYRLGEAHCGGPVVLSWWEACWGGRHRGRCNVVLHEFAHKLAERGDPNAGLPPLKDPRKAAEWEDVLAAEHEQLVEDAEYQRPTLLDPYGAVNRAEFFAVASESFFLRPVELRRRHAALYRLLAEWYRQEPADWRFEAAGCRGREAEEQYSRHVVAECTAALRRYPDYLEAYRQRAAYYRDLGEFDNALADSARLIESVGKEEKADAYYDRGCIHLEAESFESAIADFSEAIRRRADFVEAFGAHGSAYASQGQSAKALADLTRALRLDPKDDSAYFWRAQVWHKEREFDKAIRDLTRAIRLCPHEPDAYLQRALAYFGVNEHDQALADCDEAIRLDPNFAEAYRARADAYEGKGDREKAQRDRDEAARLDG